MQLYLELNRCLKGVGLVEGPIIGPLESLCICGTDLSGDLVSSGEEAEMNFHEDGSVTYNEELYSCIFVYDEKILSEKDPNWRERLVID